MKRRYFPLFVAFAFLISSPAFADHIQWYKVEVIVFEHTNKNQETLENWPEYPPINSNESTHELLPNSNHVFYKPYELLPKEGLMLQSEEDSLKRNQRYTVLLHYAWLQKLETPQKTFPVHIYGGNSRSSTYESGKIYYKQPYESQDKWKLDGLVSVSTHNNINFTANLVLNIPSQDFMQSESNPYNPSNWFNHKLVNLRMLESRNMKLGELHYIDNPLVGMLVKVSKFS